MIQRSGSDRGTPAKLAMKSAGRITITTAAGTVSPTVMTATATRS
jgi:hypothetical protein